MKRHSVSGYIACLEDALKHLKAAQHVMGSREASPAHRFVARELVMNAVAETRMYNFDNLWGKTND